MDIDFFKDIKNPLIIEGFPGYGLVSTIAMEFLISHLNTEVVGKVRSEKLPPMVAIHDGKMIEPIVIYHNPEFNILFVYSMLNPKGIEWELGNLVFDIAKRTEARGILSIEGINHVTETGDKVFMFCNNPDMEKKLEDQGVEKLREGIIMGVTSIVLTNDRKKLVDCIFVESMTEVPDSLGAARVVEILDKVIGFNIDTKPLVETAKIFEEKLKKIMEHTQAVAKRHKEEDLNYVG